MKTQFLFLLLFLFLVNVQAQKSERMKFEGTVGNYPVTMYLYNTFVHGGTMDEFEGLYYYDSQVIPMELYANADVEEEGLNLRVWAMEESETFTGVFSGDSYNGTWKKGDRSLPFSLKTVPLAKNEIPMHYYHGELEVPMGIEDEGEEIKGVYNLFYLLPEDEELQSRLMREFIANYTNFEAYKQMVFNEFTNEYKELESRVKEDNLEPGFWMNFDTQERGYPWLETEKWLTMCFHFYAYTGGAHGNYAQFYTTWDKEKQRILEAKDVWEKKYEEEISKLILQSAKKEYEIPEGEYLASGDIWTPFFSDEIPVTSNFTLAKNGIIFHYNPYEIAAYAAGIVSLFVSYDSMKPYLNPNFSFQ